MNPDTSTTTTKLCPTCGTRLSENAKRCLVCGSEISAAAGSRPAKAVQGSRMPEITLSLPAALGILALLLTVGAVVVFFVMRGAGTPTPTAGTTPTATITVTPTITTTPTSTVEPTIEPTYTPLPPVSYKVQASDTCSSLAAFFHVSVKSIVETNSLSAACSLFVGQELSIPQPTPTASPQPTATLSGNQQTEQACGSQPYTVQSGDTLSTIAGAFNVTATSIRNFNALQGDIVFEGQLLKIPLCERAATAGPTPTATPPPPYPAPSLLLPADGAPFTSSSESVSLQWSSVGTLRSNEAYAVTIEDVTEGKGRKLVEYVTDNKFIVPTTFRPNDGIPHVMRWSVLPVRQTGSDDAGKPTWEPAGESSAQRVFTWISTSSGASSTAAP